MTATQVDGKAVKEIKGVPYEEVEDLTGMKHKILDFDKFDYPRVGLIMFEFTKRADDRQLHPSLSVANTKDRNTGINFGILSEISTVTKKPVFVQVNLGKETTFDLSVPEQRKKAIVVHHSSICVDSPNRSPIIQQHLIRVHDIEKANIEEINNLNEVERAIKIAKGLAGERLYNVARNLGIMVDGVSISTVTAEVGKRALRNPKEFLRVMDNPNLERITVLKRCLSTGVIMHESYTGYTYLGRPLGHSEPEVIELFIKEPDLMTTLDMKSRDKISQSEREEQNKQIKTENPEVEALKKQIEELKANLAKQTVNEIKSDDPKLVKELEDAIEKGKKYQLKGLHMYKPTRESIDKLYEAIREKGG